MTGTVALNVPRPAVPLSTSLVCRKASDMTGKNRDAQRAGEQPDLHLRQVRLVVLLHLRVVQRQEDADDEDHRQEEYLERQQERMHFRGKRARGGVL